MTENTERQKDDAGTGAHWPITSQMTSADQAEADALNAEGKPVLAPQPYKAPQDPNLDPNVRRGGPASAAGPARTETTRDAALEANLVVEAPATGGPTTSLNSQSGQGLSPAEADAKRDEDLRKANAKKASAPNTVSSAAMQDEDGKTKPEFHADKIEKKAEARRKAAEAASKA